MSKEFIEFCRRLSKNGSAQAEWGQDLFFSHDPTYEEYLEFRKDRHDIPRLFTEEQLKLFLLTLKKKEKEKYEQRASRQTKINGEE